MGAGILNVSTHGHSSQQNLCDRAARSWSYGWHSPSRESACADIGTLTCYRVSSGEGAMSPRTPPADSALSVASELTVDGYAEGRGSSRRHSPFTAAHPVT